MSDSTISLTGRERRALKSQAKTLPVAVKFGRKGLTETALRELSRSLDLGGGLSKVSFAGDREERAAQVAEIEETLGAVCLASVGKTAAFHRPVGK
jgi:RNA-binding protein YhbY